MSTQKPESTPFVIAHATDLDPEGGIAFQHSVALARDADAVLYSMHANPDSKEVSRQMPDANEVLRQWHWQADNGVDAPTVEFHKMLHSCCDDPVDTLLDGMREIDSELLVVGKHQNKGRFELIAGSVSESLALNLNIPTLFLPIGGAGFVDEETGAVELDRVLLPVEDEASFLQTLETLRRLLERLDRTDVEVILLHVGDDSVLDDLMIPESEAGPTWRPVQREGALADEIVACVEECDVDLLVMGTHGHNSLGDVLRGSQTQRVVRRANCPVLSVPLTK